MESWVIWTFIVAIGLHGIVFFMVNVLYPKWRKQKYILPLFIFLLGAALLAIGVMILMDLLLIIIGLLLLMSAFIGVVIGLIVDFFTRHKNNYR